MEDITLAKVISLAVVDAINPCALAVLTMMLLSIITYNPKKKSNILWAGAAFTLSVFIMYIFYGLVIIKCFQLVQVISSVRFLIYKTVAILAILLGAFQIKDFFKYKIGSFSTEMPVSMRPTVQKIINKVTSPIGAFGIGAFVTIFLLPCTIGPYIILGGILSPYDILKAIPMLLLYNAIFVSPMILITILVYFGVSRIEDISSWKDENIKRLHLASGIIILLLGSGMLLGWI